MRIVHHSKTIGYAGTDRTAQLFVKYLNKIPGIEAFLVYRENDDTSRLEECKEIIGEQYLVPYKHKHAKKASPPYFPESDNLAEVLADLKPDIFHIHRSGYPEWPGMKSICPSAKFVETNIFAGVDRSPDIDLHLYISNFIAVRAKMLGGIPGPLLMNPTEPPIFSGDEAVAAEIGFRNKYGIPLYVPLLGRIGRPDNFDPIALKAFKKIQKNHPSVYYAVVNPCNRWHDVVKQLRIENVVFIPAIINDEELGAFYSSIDICAHARVDGECQPCNLNEAMYYGIPIVTHVADTYQGHVEQIQQSGAGFVASHKNDNEYAGYLARLINNADERHAIGQAGYQWAIRNVDAQVVTNKLVNLYKGLLS